MNDTFSIYGNPRMYVAYGEVVSREDYMQAIREEIQLLKAHLRELKRGAYDEEVERG